MCFYRIIDIPVYQVHRFFFNARRIFFIADCMAYLGIANEEKVYFGVELLQAST